MEDFRQQKSLNAPGLPFILKKSQEVIEVFIIYGFWQLWCAKHLHTQTADASLSLDIVGMWPELGPGSLQALRESPVHWSSGMFNRYTRYTN